MLLIFRNPNALRSWSILNVEEDGAFDNGLSMTRIGGGELLSILQVWCMVFFGLGMVFCKFVVDLLLLSNKVHLI